MLANLIYIYQESFIMLKKILSYIYPITIYKEKSSISDEIKVLLYNGNYLLDTTNTNYSYGSLQKVLKKGLYHIGKETIQQMDSCLLLGVAGGSVVKTLTEEFQFNNQIIGVELDEHIISIANKYFNLNKIENFTCVIDDAQLYIKNTSLKFDLIIIDIFQDRIMPEFLFIEEFVSNYKKLLKPKGFIIFNFMWIGKEKISKINQFCSNFKSDEFLITHLKAVEHYNDLFIIQKLF